jgi:hypothetical protein
VAKSALLPRLGSGKILPPTGKLFAGPANIGNGFAT